MKRRGLSAKLERHLERGEEEMRLSRAAAERHEATFERLMASFDRHEVAFERLMAGFDRHEEASKRVKDTIDSQEERVDDFKVFVRDINRRSEKVVQDLLRGNREFCRELTAKTDGKAETIMAELKDLREESQAQRQALLSLIDRLPPPKAA
jgi:chromosome segregation ATPase